MTMVERVAPKAEALYLEDSPTEGEDDGFGPVMAYSRKGDTNGTDAMAWAEIERRRGNGESDKDIWLDAAQQGDINILGAFIRKPPQGFDINWTNVVGQSALHQAVSLLGYFAANPGDMTPEQAREHGGKRAMEVLKLLIEDGKIDQAKLIKAYPEDPGLSAYSIAAQYDKIPEMKEITKYLREQLDGEAKTALEKGDQKRVNELMAAGADPKPIWFDAVRKGKTEVIKSILKNPPKGFDVNAESEHGKTALHEAMFADENITDTVKTLVEDGKIDLAKLDNALQSGYHLAVKFGNKNIPELKEVAKYLKEKLNTEADAAVKNKDQERLDALVKAGADAKTIEGPEDKPRYGPPRGDWKRPKSEKRSAKEIVEQTPVLKGLAPNLKDWLKNGFGDGTPFKGIGDYEENTEEGADRAYRAVKMLEHIQNYDKNGARITGDIKPDHLHGFFKDDGEWVANPNTESARFQDFTKYGWDSLKGGATPPVTKDPPKLDTKRPEGYKRSVSEIMGDYPLLAKLSGSEISDMKKKVGDWDDQSLSEDDRADAAYRAARVLEHIENFGPEGKIDNKDNTIGNHRIDGYFKDSKGRHRANPNTEAARLQDFFKQETPEKAFEYLKGYKAPVEADAEPDDFVTTMKHEAYHREIAKANLPEDRKDMLENPDKYTAQQRYAARLELSLLYDRITTQPEHWEKHKLNDITEAIDEAVTKLTNEDVDKYAEEHEPKALQAVLGSDPAKREKAERLYKEMRDNAAGLDKYIKDDIRGGMTDYYAVAQTLNLALGKDGEPLDESLVINIKDHPSYDKIEKEYKDSYAKSDTLSKLVDEKGEKEGFAEFSSRGVLFSGYGMGLVQDFAADNLQNYLMRDVGKDDLNNSGIVNDKGEVDEEFLNKTLAKLRKDDPNNPIFKDENGEDLSNAQIVTAARAAFDAFRNTGKVNAANGKANLKQFLATDSKLKQAFGSGVMHAVSSVLCAGISIARGAEGGLSTEAKVAVAANAIQAFGVGIQAFEFSQRPDNFNNSVLKKYWTNNKLDGLTQDQIKTHFDNKRTAIMNLGKTLNGVGGMAAGAMGILFGVQAKQAGDEAMAAVFFAQGVSNLLTASGPISEVALTAFAKSILKWDNAKIGRVVAGTIFKWIGTASGVLNGVAVVAALAYTIYDAIKNEDKIEDYTNTWQPMAESYGLPVEMANWPTTGH
jgi:hypothetical protein